MTPSWFGACLDVVWRFEHSVSVHFGISLGGVKMNLVLSELK